MYSPCKEILHAFRLFLPFQKEKKGAITKDLKILLMQEGRLLLMKFRRFFSSLIFGFGCFFCFIGLIAIVLPSIHNSRLQLVLSGFEMPSEQVIVEVINRFMRFVLAKNWYIFLFGLFAAALGSLLYLHFAPKEQLLIEQEKRITPVSEDRPVKLASGEKPNPFAKATYQLPFIPEETQRFFHPEPILERNPIESADVTPAPANELEPYFSNRFATETRAIESETGTRSQSGSQILIRLSPETPSEKAPEAESEPAESMVENMPVQKINVSSHASLHPVHAISPRIRSTMGKHRH